MYISDLLGEGKVVGTRQPTHGVLCNVLERTRRRGSIPFAIAPIGKLEITGGDNFWHIASANSPVYITPRDENWGAKQGKSTKLTKGEGIDMETLYDWEIVKGVFKIKGKHRFVDEQSGERYVNHLDEEDRKYISKGQEAYRRIKEDFFKLDYFPKEADDRFTLRPVMKSRKWRAFRDTGFLYCMTTTENWLFILMNIQKVITESYQGKHMDIKVTGLGTVTNDGSTVKLRNMPRDQVNFGGSNQLLMQLEDLDLRMVQLRTIYTYMEPLTLAFKELVDLFDLAANINAKTGKINTGNSRVQTILSNERMKGVGIPGSDQKKRGLVSEAEAYRCIVNYIVGAYAGMNKVPPQDMLYSSADAFDETLSYLGLPFSESYPFMLPTIIPHWMELIAAETGDQKKLQPTQILQARILKQLLLVNTLLTIAGMRVGGRAHPIKYLKLKGSYRTIKEIMPMYLKPPFTASGTNNLWMHLSSNVNLEDQLCIPYPVVQGLGANKWLMNRTEPETFSDVIVDRGEMPLNEDDSTTPGACTRLIPTRDARSYIVRKWNEEFLILRWPRATHSKNSTSGFALLMSYITDPTLSFSGGVKVTDRFMTPQASEVHMNRYGIYDDRKLRGISSEPNSDEDIVESHVVEAAATNIPGAAQIGGTGESPGVQHRGGSVKSTEFTEAVPAVTENEVMEKEKDPDSQNIWPDRSENEASVGAARDKRPQPAKGKKQK